MIEHNYTKKELESLQSFCKGNAITVNESQDKNTCVQERENSSVATAKERKFSEEFCSLISEVNFNALVDDVHKTEQADAILAEQADAACQDNLETTLKRASQQTANLQEQVVPEQTNNYEDLPRKLEMAQRQIYTYERENDMLLKRVQELECQIQSLNAEISTSKSVPPPPPPPPPTLFKPIKSFITFISSGKKTPKTSPKKDASFEDPHQKAMIEMIDAIKKGNIQLKPTPKNVTLDKQETSAVGEMENILKTFKRREWPCISTNLEAEKKIGNFEKSRALDEASTSLSTPKNIEDKCSDDELHSVFNKKSLKLAANDGHESISSNIADANMLRLPENGAHDSDVLCGEQSISNVINANMS